MAHAPSTILLIDDDANVRRAFGRLEAGNELVLHTCSTVAEAERLMARVQVDVAVVDHHLGPGDPSGLEWLMRLRRQDGDCYRILFTGAADLDFVVKAINQGAIDAFLLKPWSPEQAVALLIQGCETALLRRHNRSLLDELALRNNELLEFNTRLEELVAERTSHLTEAHERLRRQQAELVQLETRDAVGQLVRGLAHELNNPLAAILGYSQRLRRRLAADADAVQRLDVILSEVERCRSLVDQLRHLGAPLEESPEPCDPLLALREAAARLASGGRAVPDIATDGEIPLVVAAPRSLVRIFEAAVANAADAHARRMVLSGRQEGERVRLDLANDGDTPTKLETRNAGRPFFTTRTAEGHRGLGLAAASGLLREQGGSIGLDAPADGRSGALVVVHLPAPAPPERPITATFTAQRGEPVVLIVDDEPLVAELVVDTLRGQGYATRVVGTAAAALEAVRQGGLTALLVDHNLPDGNGADLARRAVALRPALAGHIAIATGGGDDLAQRLVADTGMPVLQKPFRLEQVTTLMRQIAS